MLDNVIEPTYILRVDVSNPSHLQIISTFEIVGINHHLKRQWLNPSLNQWYILQSYGTQAGSGQNVITFSMNLSTGCRDFSDSQIPFELDDYMASGYQAISYSNFAGSEFKGTELITVTPLPPNWAVIHDRQEELYLALIDNQSNYIVFDRKVYLGELKDCYYLKAEIKPLEKLLFIVFKGSKNNNFFTRLLIIDVAQKPSIILNQDLDELGFSSLNVAHCLCRA